MKLVSFDCKNQEQVHAIAKLHEGLLRDSPVSQLGYRFMTEFYYTKLVRLGLINCDLYKDEGEYIAFSVYTKYPFTFMKEGIHRYFFYLSFLLFKILLLHPFRTKTISKVIQISRMTRLHEGKGENKTGEILSFGVLKPYRNLKDETTGLRISNLLFEHAITFFRNEGFLKIHGKIKKDNKTSLLFWHSYGAIIKDYNWDRGRSYLVSIEL